MLLVIVHEYGHFIVARWCGVKVLRFSFGFGPIIARWRDKRATEYALSLVPLGGYVKMLDETEGDVSEQEKHLAFNRQSLWVRSAIVIAGPLFNFMFAFAALWLVLVIGMYSLAPMVEGVKPNSIAARAGLQKDDEIIALGDMKISSWRDFQYAMMPMIGSDDTVSLTVKSMSTGVLRDVRLPLNHWQLDEKKPDALDSLGIVPFEPAIPPVVGEVVPDAPAALAGLMEGDRVLQVNGKAFDDWLFLVDYVKTRPNTRLSLLIDRQGKQHEISVTTGQQDQDGVMIGYLGVRSKKVDWPKNWLRLDREGPVAALGTAFQQTVFLTRTTLILMGRLVTGQLGLKSISGPVGIAQGAGDSGRSGLVYYLFFLALVSISLGVLNLLPVPMLDGGHLLFNLIEAIQRRPVSEKVKSVGVYVGLVLLVALMVIAMSNDIARLRA